VIAAVTPSTWCVMSDEGKQVRHVMSDEGKQVRHVMSDEGKQVRHVMSDEGEAGQTAAI
jgi:hypothetical protein